MREQVPGSPVVVTVVHAPACHYCQDAQDALRELATGVDLDVRVVELESAQGADLVARHRPAMNPLVLVDGQYFSSGRLPRKKLRALLERRGVLAPSVRAGRLSGVGRGH